MSTKDSKDVKLERFPHLLLKSNTPKGRGVFAATRIPSQTIIDVSPVLLLDQNENASHIERTSLYHYTYNWPVVAEDGSRRIAQAVVFGLGSMFNHSARGQNVVWERDPRRLVITYKAARDIDAGEELCISYGDHLTFVDADRESSPSYEEQLAEFNRIHADG